ncbi:Mitochondrial import receptor subunit TOM40-like 1, partial [Fragariocoptes setiger]
MASDRGPTFYEELHRKVKEIQPMVFDGIRIVLNRPLSPNFQLSHSMNMGAMQSSYRFGVNFVGTKKVSPMEMYPVMASEIDCDGQLNANLIHLLTPRIKAKMVGSFSRGQCTGSQVTLDYRGDDYTSSLTLANIDLAKNQGVAAAHFLQQVTAKILLGTELLYQYGSMMPGISHMAMLGLAGRYTSDNFHWNASVSTSRAHVTYYHKANDNFQLGAEFMSDMSMGQSNASFFYQADLPKSNLVFRGSVDAAWNVGAVLEKRFAPFPVTFILSADLNHAKHATTVGVGMTNGCRGTHRFNHMSTLNEPENEIISYPIRNSNNINTLCAHSDLDIVSRQNLGRIRRAAAARRDHHPSIEAARRRAHQSQNHDASNKTDQQQQDVAQVVNEQAPNTGDKNALEISNKSVADSRRHIVKTIETAVFIDRALDMKFVGRGGLTELNRLVLAIMSQVQMIFSYKSMKVPIKINIVRVEHLKEVDEQPSTENGDIDGYLGSFCEWQERRLEQFPNAPWDHAILLTGLDLYKSNANNNNHKNHSGVLGLAWVGGMCKRNYSCTINEAMSFESAFVIAHEMGHSLGILHDGQQNNCDRNSYIMSERTGAGKIHWSTCSSYYLNEAIKQRHLQCLDTESAPVDPLFSLTRVRSPGQVYDVNDQCHLAFGHNYTSIMAREKPFNSICRELWCVSGSWAKAAHPALEGSICDQDGQVCTQ